MPYQLKKVAGGYKVESKNTGRTHSNHPLPRADAVAQMRALYANVPEARPKRNFDHTDPAHMKGPRHRKGK